MTPHHNFHFFRKTASQSTFCMITGWQPSPPPNSDHEPGKILILCSGKYSIFGPYVVCLLDFASPRSIHVHNTLRLWTCNFVHKGITSRYTIHSVQDISVPYCTVSMSLHYHFDCSHKNIIQASGRTEEKRKESEERRKQAWKTFSTPPPPQTQIPIHHEIITSRVRSERFLRLRIGEPTAVTLKRKDFTYLIN
jgi:hypothetical protein